MYANGLFLLYEILQKLNISHNGHLYKVLFYCTSLDSAKDIKIRSADLPPLDVPNRLQIYHKQ